MPSLIRDRYIRCGPGSARDLATGDVVPLTVAEQSPLVPPALDAVIEVLEHGQEGVPRRVLLAAASRARVVHQARAAAAAAQSRGFVPVAADLYLQLRHALEEELAHRSLVLLAPDGDPSGPLALLVAAAACARPHVLLAWRTSAAGGASVAREARAVYGQSTAGTPRALAIDPDAERHRQRAARAGEFVRAGRHAAAERLLRDVARALARRRHLPYAARTTIELGRLLLERGRVADADRAFEDAAALATQAGDARVMLDARLWQAAARTDAGRFTDAEALCRAALAADALHAGQRALAHAMLARLALWQGRAADAAALDVRLPAEHGLDPGAACFVAATSVRTALASGRTFEAGLLARQLLSDAAGGDLIVRIMARTAHLRLLASSGDLDLAAEARDEVVSLAREARTPLRALRARVIFAEAMRSAGRTAAVRPEIERLQRLGRAAPPLLARSIRGVASRPVERPAPAPHLPRPLEASLAVRLVTIAHEQDDDERAVRGVMHALASECRTSRLDIVSADAGPATTILTAGSGLATRLGSRVLDAGVALGPEPQGGGIELGVPLQPGRVPHGALVARWPADRAPGEGVREVLELAAAVIGPRVEALQARVRASAQAAAAIPALVGQSAAMADLRAAVARAAPAPFAVLIQGESGTGKELVARAIHQLSPRRERRFCDINCAAVPDDLFESEVFGHARGAFTGAITERAGLFEEAHGGTLFLDEIADLSPRGQAKLLRVLQQQEVRRIGETFSRPVDVRVVAAANRDVRGEAESGRFRQDLLYRLDVIGIRIPPLRDRPEDVPLLAQHFWAAAAARVGTSATLSHGVLAALSRYHWPGNVRELQNVIAALAVGAPGRGIVRPQLLPPAITSAAAVAATRLADARAQLERRMIESALARAGGSRTRAARELGVSRQGLLKIMARLAGK